MSLLFPVRKPRRFHHEPIYRDERKEQLRQLEQRARRELGMEPDRPDDGHAVYRSVLRSADRDRCRHGQHNGSSSRWLALLIILLIAVLIYFL